MPTVNLSAVVDGCLSLYYLGGVVGVLPTDFSNCTLRSDRNGHCKTATLGLYGEKKLHLKVHESIVGLLEVIYET